MRKKILLFFLILSSFAFAQGSKEKALIKQVDKAIADNYKSYAPGCAVLIAKKGEVIFEKGFGLANMELNVPMTSRMVFRVGSITKQFTAIAILKLVEEGKISLADTIQRFLSNFHYKGKPITIEHLLSHTSGIRGYEEIDAKIPDAIRIDFLPKTVIDSLDRLSLEFDPGTKFNYSNSNYFLLANIIEQVSGQSYPRYLKEQILDPAGLTETYYESYTQIIPGRVAGYSFSDGKYQNAGFISMALVYGAGALRSNVHDLFTWHKALYEGRIIKKETLLKAITPFKLADGKPIDYGYGFFIKNENGMPSIGHGGAIDGFRAIEMYYPEQDVFIALLCNSDQDNYEQLYRVIMGQVLGIQTSGQLKEIQLGGDILEGYVGTYKNDKYQVSIKIYRANGRIYGDLSNGTGSYLMFMALTETQFYLPDIQRIKTMAEFVKENGIVTKLILTQEEPVTFVKLE